jgi:hypothetical protein
MDTGRPRASGLHGTAMPLNCFVIPAKAGIDSTAENRCAKWIPAYAGMTHLDTSRMRRQSARNLNR